MSAIQGYLNFNGDNNRLINKMQEAISEFPHDYKEIWSDQYISLGHQLQITSSIDKNEKLPFFDKKNNITITCNARLDNRTELIKKLNLDTDKVLTDSHIILLSWLRFEEACVNYLMGDFTFVIWDCEKKYLFVARDQLGCVPLYYYKNKNKFIFSTDKISLLALEEISKNIDELWIADSLMNIYGDHTNTFHEKIKRLAPGHCISIRQDSFKLNRYFDWKQGKAKEFQSEKEGLKALSIELDRAVRVRMDVNNSIACELSGGLDSSAVTAIAHKYSKKFDYDLHAYSHVLAKKNLGKIFPFTDERKFSKKVCQYLGLRHHHYIDMVNEGVIEPFKALITRQGGPSAGGIGSGSHVIYKQVKKKGVRVILSGYGGDQGVSNLGERVAQELLRKNDWVNFLRDRKLSGCSDLVRHTFATLITLYFPFIRCYQAKIKLFNIYNKKLEKGLIKAEFANKLKLKQRLFDYPILSYTWDKRSLNEYMEYVLSSPSLSIRMEDSFINAAAEGVTYRYPLLDLKLIQTYLALPVNLRKKNGISRYPFRMIISEFLPDSISWRKDKSKAAISSLHQRYINDKKIILQLLINSNSLGINQYINIGKTIGLINNIKKNRPIELEGKTLNFSLQLFLYNMK